MSDAQRSEAALQSGAIPFVLLCALGVLGAQSWLPLLSFICDVYSRGPLSFSSALPYALPFLCVSAFACIAVLVALKKGISVSTSSIAMVGFVLVVLGCAVQVVFDASLSMEKITYIMSIVGLLLGLGGGLLVSAWIVFLGSLQWKGYAALCAVVAAYIMVCVPQLCAGRVGLNCFLVATVALSAASSMLHVYLVRRVPRIGVNSAVHPVDVVSAEPRCGRVALCMGLCGFAFGAMLIMLLSGPFGRALSFTWVFGFVGIADCVIVFLLCQRILKNGKPARRVLRLSCVPAIVAFFPLEWGTESSLQFAVAASTFALWFMFSAIALKACESKISSADRRACLLLAVASGLLLGGALGCACAALVDSVIMVVPNITSVISLVSIIAVLAATNLVGPEWENRISVADGAAVVGKGEAEPASSVNVGAVVERYGLTERESQVLAILAQGYGLARVQEELVISEGTAITHRQHIYQKLNVHSRNELLDLVSKHQ